MKVISILQPWASLIIQGHKKIETRSWNTKYRGELLIHASAGKKPVCRSLMLDFQQEFSHLNLQKFESLPFGAIIGKVNLIATVQSIHCFSGNQFEITNYSSDVVNGHFPKDLFEITDQELAFGDYSENRFGWLLSDPIIFENPIPAKGKLGLWEYDWKS